MFVFIMVNKVLNFKIRQFFIKHPVSFMILLRAVIWYFRTDQQFNNSDFIGLNDILSEALFIGNVWLFKNLKIYS